MIMRMFMRLGAVTQVVPAGQGSPLQPEPESGLSSGWGSRCEPRWGCTGRRTSCGLAPWPGIGGGGIAAGMGSGEQARMLPQDSSSLWGGAPGALAAPPPRGSNAPVAAAPASAPRNLTPVKVGSILLIPRLVHDQHPPRLRLVCADLHLMSTVFS